MAKLRVGLVGYGFIAANGHVPALLARAREVGDVELVAVADVCAERREAARSALPGVRIYPSHDALLAAERRSLDLLDIAVPPAAHAAVAHAAFDAGLHVLCEKPLAVSTREAVLLLEHAKAARRVLFPCHNYKHAPVVKAVRELISADRIGKVRLVTLNTLRNTHAKGVPEWNTDWRRQKRHAGGGIAMDHGSHSFYLAFEWLGASPTAVTAKMSTLDAWDTEDNFSCTITFPSGLAVAQLTWTAGVRKVIYTIQGERGGITVDDDDISVSTHGNNGSGWHTERVSVASHWSDASHVAWFGSLFEQVVQAIQVGDFVGKEAREALMCVHLIERAYDSAARSCVEVSLDTQALLSAAQAPVERARRSPSGELDSRPWA